MLRSNSIFQKTYQVKRDLILIRKSILFQSYWRSLIGHPDDQSATLGVQKAGDALEHSHLHPGVFLTRMKVGAEGRLELDCARLTRRDQLRDFDSTRLCLGLASQFLVCFLDR